MVYESFPPHNQSGSARPFSFAVNLPAFGYAPHVITTEVPPDQLRDDEAGERLDAQCAVSRGQLVTRWLKNGLLRALGALR